MSDFTCHNCSSELRLRCQFKKKLVLTDFIGKWLKPGRISDLHSPMPTRTPVHGPSSFPSTRSSSIFIEYSFSKTESGTLSTGESALRQSHTTVNKEGLTKIIKTALESRPENHRRSPLSERVIQRERPSRPRKVLPLGKKPESLAPIMKQLDETLPKIVFTRAYATVARNGYGMGSSLNSLFCAL